MAKGPKGPLWFLHGAKITNHADRENYLAANMLNGWESSENGEQYLIDLFRSKVEIDRQTRTAIADALERKEGLRLDLIRGDGRPSAGTAKIRLQRELQEIAEDVYSRIANGEAPKNAKADVARDRNIGLTKIKEALAYQRSSRGLRIQSKNEGEAD